MHCSVAALSRVGQTASNTNGIEPQRRTKKVYAIMQTAVRYSYPGLKSSYKYLYDGLCEFDFPDKDTKYCKGYIYLTSNRIAMLAQNAACDESTIYRWLKKLVQERLIKIRRRQNRSSVVYLLDIPQEKLSTHQNEGHFAKMPTVNNRNISSTRRLFANCKNVDFVFSAREYSAYERLVAFGYHPRLAIHDISVFGVEEIEIQLENLHTCLNEGRAIKTTVAQWLNASIRTKHRIHPSELSQVATTTLKSSIEESYELVKDENGYEYFQPKGEGVVVTQEGAETAKRTSPDIAYTQIPHQQLVEPCQNIDQEASRSQGESSLMMDVLFILYRVFRVLVFAALRAVGEEKISLTADGALRAGGVTGRLASPALKTSVAVFAGDSPRPQILAAFITRDCNLLTSYYHNQFVLYHGPESEGTPKGGLGCPPEFLPKPLLPAGSYGIGCYRSGSEAARSVVRDCIQNRDKLVYVTSQRKQL